MGIVASIDLQTLWWWARLIGAPLAAISAVVTILLRYRQWRQAGAFDYRRLAEVGAVAANAALVELLPASSAVDVTFGERLVRGAQPPRAGTLTTILDFYEQTPTRRLVILGDSGAGKTVLALALRRALLADGARGADQVPAQIPLTVNLATWDSDLSAAAAVARALGEREAVGWRALSSRRLLLVLDGLDETDPEDEPPRRAVEVLRQLNTRRIAGRIPVVVTCRTSFYERLTPAQRLADATVVHVDDLTTQMVADHLAQLAEGDAAWAEVVRTVDEDPAGALARCLTRPWWLSTVTTVCSPSEEPPYQPRLTPAELIALADRGELDDRLRREYADLLVTRLRRHRRRGRRALGELAAYLQANRAQAREVDGVQLSSSELVVHQLWPLGGPRRVLAVDTALAVLLSLPGLVWGALLTCPQGLLPALGYAVFVAVFLGALVRATTLAWFPPRRLELRRLLRPAPLFVQSVTAMLFALAFTVTVDGAVGAAAGVLAWAALGLNVGSSPTVLSSADFDDRTPDRPVRDDHLLGMMAGVAGIPLGAVALAQKLPWPVAVALSTTYGLMVGWTVGSGVWRRYLALLLTTRGRMPWRLRGLLQEAHSVGILRRTGTAYRFRHQELLEQFAGPAVVPAQSDDEPEPDGLAGPVGVPA